MQRNVHPRRGILISVLLAAVPALNADVTLRYETKVTVNPNVPAQLTEQMTKAVSAGLPSSSKQQYRNGKLLVGTAGTNVMVDLSKREVTLIDPGRKRYATVPADQYSDEAARLTPQLPAQATALMASMKSHSEAKLTGRTETIQGIEAEEHEVVMTIDSPPGLGVPDGPMVRMVMHVWTAKGSEALRVGALREVAGYRSLSLDEINPVAVLKKGFGQFPGLSEGLASLMNDLQGSLLLRMRMELSMPMLAGMMKQLPAGAANPFGAGFDANAPLMELTQDLGEISTAEIPDSVFQVPEGYQAAGVGEIMRDVVAQATAAATAPSGTAMPATLLSQVKPVYPAEAKAARVEGSVSFNAIIAKDGTVKDLQLSSGHPLLVQAAMDAVKQWVYKPTLLNGEPVEVQTKIDVNFSLSGGQAAPK